MRYSSILFPHPLFFWEKGKLPSWEGWFVCSWEAGIIAMLPHLCGCGLASVSSSVSRRVHYSSSICMCLWNSLFSLWTLLTCYSKWEILKSQGGKKIYHILPNYIFLTLLFLKFSVVTFILQWIPKVLNVKSHTVFI